MNKLNLTWREVFDSYQSPIHDIENIDDFLASVFSQGLQAAQHGIAIAYQDSIF